jgi:hypothetical protein
MTPLQPSDMAELVGMLLNGLSPDERARVPAEASLALWQGRPGYFSLLKELIVDREAPLQARWLASCCFKNGIRKGWRRVRRVIPGGIAEDEKAHLRTQLLVLVDVLDEPIAKQVAEIVAQVARVEFPSGWPELLPSLGARLGSYVPGGGGDGLVASRVVARTLHAVIKQLATKRLQADRMAFAALCSGLFPQLHSMWASQSAALLSGAAPADSIEALSDVVRYCTKSLRLLLLSGMPEFHSSEHATSFVNSLPQRIQGCIELYQRLTADEFAVALTARAYKCVLAMSSTAVELMGEMPRECWACGVIQSCLVLFRAVLAAKSVDIDDLRVHAMHFYIRVLLVDDCAVVQTLEGGAWEATGRETQLAVEEFFQDVIAELVQVAVGRLLPVTPEEMHTWAQDPESYLAEQHEQSWEDDVKPCAETLLLTLMERRQVVATPIMLELVTHVLKASLHGCSPPQADSSVASALASELQIHPVLLQETVLRVAGITAFHIAEHIDFETWYNERLLPLLSSISADGPEHRAVRRRVVWFLGQWCTAGALPSQARPSLYAALIPLLADKDVAIALTAAQTLCDVIDDVGFDPASFAEFASPVLDHVLTLLDRTSQGASKLAAMTVLSLLVERLGHAAEHLAPQIAQCLPVVWASAALSDDDNYTMVKSIVVRAANQLTLALGSNAAVLFEFTIPATCHCTDTSHIDHVYLLEDGLQLWMSMLQNACALTPPLLELYGNAGPIMERDFDNLIEIHRITSSYMLLGGERFMAQHATDVVAVMAGCLGQVRDRGLVAVAETTDLLLQVFPAQGPVLIQGILEHMLSVLIDGKFASAVGATYALVVGRVIFLNGDVFWAVLERIAATQGIDCPALLGGLLDAWLPLIQAGISTVRKKICAMAAVTMLEPPGSWGVEAATVAAQRRQGTLAVCSAVARDAEREGLGALEDADVDRVPSTRSMQPPRA